MKTALEMVKEKPDTIRYMSDEQKSPEVCLEAVRHDGLLIHFVPVEKQTEALALAAVKRRGEALKYISIDLQTPQVCRAAVSSDPCAIRHVMAENLTNELQDLARF